MLSIVPYNQVRRNDLLQTRNNLNGFYNIFDDFFGNSISRNQGVIRNVFKVDVVEKDNEYFIEADLPGVSKENINLNIEDNGLIISVTQEEEKTNEDKNYLHKERYMSSMKRRINLKDVKFDLISAKLDNGVLSIAVPKDTSLNEVRKIEIA